MPPRRALSVFHPKKFWMDDFFDFVDVDFAQNELEMYEDDDNVVVKIKAPGFDDSNVDISIEDSTLTISGRVEEEKEEEDKKKKYYYKEMSHKSFNRSVTLPVRVKADQADANFDKGILEIRLPKAEEVKPKRISIKAK